MDRLKLMLGWKKKLFGFLKCKWLNFFRQQNRISAFMTVQTEGKRMVQRNLEYYNSDFDREMKKLLENKK